MYPKMEFFNKNQLNSLENRPCMKGQLVLISYDTTYLCGTQEYNKHVSNCDSYMESIQSYVFGEQQIGKEGHYGKM